MKNLLFLIFCLFLSSNTSSAQALDIKLLQGMKARNIGPAGMSGRVTAIDVNLSNPDIIYAGTASGGLWKSEGGGIDWTPIFDEEPAHSIGAVAIFQKTPDVVWVGAGEGNPRNSQSAGTGCTSQSMAVRPGCTWDWRTPAISIGSFCIPMILM